MSGKRDKKVTFKLDPAIHAKLKDYRRKRQVELGRDLDLGQAIEDAITQAQKARSEGRSGA